VAHVYNPGRECPNCATRLRSGFQDDGFRGVPRLLRRGRPYQQAVEAFQPYTETRDPNPEARESMRVLIGRARENHEFLFLFVNNRLEGNAPLTILSLAEP